MRAATWGAVALALEMAARLASMGLMDLAEGLRVVLLGTRVGLAVLRGAVVGMGLTLQVTAGQPLCFRL